MPLLSCGKCGKEFEGRSAARVLSAHSHKCTSDREKSDRNTGAFQSAVENDNMTLQNDFMDSTDQNDSQSDNDERHSSEYDSSSDCDDQSDNDNHSDDGSQVELEYEEDGKWDYTGISRAQSNVSQDHVTEAEAKLARLAKDIGLINSQASAVMKWSNERIGYVK